MATMPHPIRVDQQLWDEFGEAARAIGSDRTKVLVGFMRRFVDAMGVQLATEAEGVDRLADTDQGPGSPHSAR